MRNSKEPGFQERSEWGGKWQEVSKGSFVDPCRDFGFYSEKRRPCN